MTTETATSAPHPAEAGPVNGQRVLRAIVREDTHQTASAGAARRTRLARLVDQLTPPEPWTHRPASLAAMWRYARRGGWTGPQGAARRAGVWWFRLVALPATVLAHYAAWTVARPARTATVVALWVVLMQLRPARALAAAILPWSPWW